MRKNYKCSNVKFCMEDENQRRTWEYLQGITRKDGSYGKVLSDVFAAFLDGQDQEKEKQNGNGRVLLNSVFSADERNLESERIEQVLGHIFERFEERMLMEIRQLLTERIRDCFIEFASDLANGAVRDPGEVVVTDTGDIGETQEQEMSEDMMAFAFGMGE